MILVKSVQDKDGAFVGLLQFQQYFETPALRQSIVNTLWIATAVTGVTVPLANAECRAQNSFASSLIWSLSSTARIRGRQWPVSLDTNSPNAEMKPNSFAVDERHRCALMRHRSLARLSGCDFC